MDDHLWIDGPAARQIRDLAIPASLEGADGIDDAQQLVGQLRDIHDDFIRLRMYYQFAIDEMATKIDILRGEFELLHDYSPIEHVRTRLKTMESLVAKARRTGEDMTITAIRARIHDIAGIRITCSFTPDVYWIADMLAAQPDLTVLEVKDYIAAPKPNGYRSLHVILEVPVFLSTHTEHIPVELQIRTIAMDFWASVEHKLSYKYHADLPGELRAELDDAARVAHELDTRMERLREEIRPMADPPYPHTAPRSHQPAHPSGRWADGASAWHP